MYLNPSVSGGGLQRVVQTSGKGQDRTGIVRRGLCPRKQRGTLVSGSVPGLRRTGCIALLEIRLGVRV